MTTRKPSKPDEPDEVAVVRSPISDVVWQAIIAAVVTIVLTWMQLATKAAVEKGAATAEQGVAVVAKKLDETTVAADVKLTRIEKTGEKTHASTNSAMELQLRLNASLSRRIATLSKDPADAKLADLAEEMHRSHVAAQKANDAKEGK